MLEKADLTLSLSKKDYEAQLLEAQLRLRAIALRMYRQQRSAVVVYEGWDAAGKGGNIRRITEKLDPRGYHVYQIAAPAGDDKIHHYLWRFWRRLLPPDEKQIVLFDRSWYGRVLVERVEGFATEPAWRRSYREINEFEQLLQEAGIAVVKFWIHISADEQLRRFEARKDTPYKSWKLTDEDWRNRQKWDDYEEAVEEMLLRTSPVSAPWIVVEGNDKRFARVRAARHLADTLAIHLDAPGPDTGNGMA
jgi:polyphosphate kinase 2 (PPK2 family)